jgi:hypothetical protein
MANTIIFPFLLLSHEQKKAPAYKTNITRVLTQEEKLPFAKQVMS